MEGLAGAVVVMDPRSGDVLAMVSTPAFEIDRFHRNHRARRVAARRPGSELPLLNRTIQTQYAPGSVSRSFVAAAGLQEGSLTAARPDTLQRRVSPGHGHLQGWKDGGHGTVDLHNAIAQSCNIFFYEAGLKIGGRRSYATRARSGSASRRPSTCRGRRPALLPRPQGWGLPRAGRQGADATRPARRSICPIGQGTVLVTPMQVARFMGRDRQRRRPLARVSCSGSSASTASCGATRTGRRHVELSPVVWAFLRRSLWAVVNEGGTGVAARIPGSDIAGKTGHAQMVAKSKAEKGQDHAWFASFAPAKAPEVVVVVIGGAGG